MARDARQDGRFVFAVRTTGVYCRPSCPSRRPRRDSVEFFADPREAERAGYRACLRCKPTEISAQAQYVLRARQLLDNAEGVVTLAQLSKRVGLSPFHLQRLFKRATGLSPREYQSARRMQHVKTELRKGEDVTTALYDAGFSSPSRLYENVRPAARHDAGHVSPRRRGCDHHVRHCADSAGTNAGCRHRARPVRRALRRERDRAGARPARRIPRRRHCIATMLPCAVTSSRCWPAFAARTPRLICRSTCAPPPSRRKSGRRCSEIPRGETRSYTDVAREIGDPQAVRAVARACASNPVALAVPCHRVVRSDGDLAGYRWGVERKKKLSRWRTAFLDRTITSGE